MLRNKARFYTLSFILVPVVVIFFFRDALVMVFLFPFMIFIGGKLVLMKCIFCGNRLIRYWIWGGSELNFWTKVIKKNECPSCGKKQQ